MKKVLLSAALFAAVGLVAQSQIPPVKNEKAVGINTTKPRTSLDVNGDLRVQDVKEMNLEGSKGKIFPNCKPCFLVIDEYGVVKRVPQDKIYGGGANSLGDVKTGKVGGSATFSGLSDVEENIVSLIYKDKEIQGRITATGIPVQIPYTGASAGDVAETIVEYGDDKNLKLKISQTTIQNGDGVLDAVIYYDKVGGYDLKLITYEEVKDGNYKQPQAGFKLKVNGVETPALITLNALGGIPDRMYDVQTDGKLEHQFVYLPVLGPDGRTWLNNNLGARYANSTVKIDGVYDPGKQAKTLDDKNAFGSLFQWGRKPDGHEITNWYTSSGNPGVDWTKTPLNSWTEEGLRWVRDADAPDYGWVKAEAFRPIPEGLWTSEAPDKNNPCPIGFRVASTDEGKALVQAGGPALKEMTEEDVVRVPTSRKYLQSSTYSFKGQEENQDSRFWLTTVVQWTKDKPELGFGAETLSFIGQWRSRVSNGYPVRCIQND